MCGAASRTTRALMTQSEAGWELISSSRRPLAMLQRWVFRMTLAGGNGEAFGLVTALEGEPHGAAILGVRTGVAHDGRHVVDARRHVSAEGVFDVSGIGSAVLEVEFEESARKIADLAIATQQVAGFGLWRAERANVASHLPADATRRRVLDVGRDGAEASFDPGGLHGSRDPGARVDGLGAEVEAVGEEAKAIEDFLHFVQPRQVVFKVGRQARPGAGFVLDRAEDHLVVVEAISVVDDGLAHWSRADCMWFLADCRRSAAPAM